MTHRSAIAQQAATWTPPADLAAWYYGNSVTDSKWTDRSGAGNHATLGGLASLSASGLWLPGASTDFADVPVVLTGQSLTVSMWAWLEADTSTYTVLFGANSYNTGCMFGLQRTGAQAMQMWINSDKIVSANNTIIATGQWQHTAMVFDDDLGQGTLYVDGASVGSGAISSSIPTAASGRMGNSPVGFQAPAKGLLDDVFVHLATLSESDISDIIANSPGSHA